MQSARAIAIIASVTLLAASFNPVTAQTATFGTDTKVVRIFEHELGSNQSQAYRVFKKNCCYFGAFAINTGSDHGFFTQGFNSTQTAIDAAELGCREVSKAENADPAKCRLYAYSLPEEIAPTNRSAKGMGVPAREYFLSQYHENQIRTGYGAFALGPARGYGASWNWPTADQAREAALAHCEADIAQVIATVGPPARQWAKRNRLNECRIVHETAPAK